MKEKEKENHVRFLNRWVIIRYGRCQITQPLFQHMKWPEASFHLRLQKYLPLRFVLRVNCAVLLNWHLHTCQSVNFGGQGFSFFIFRDVVYYCLVFSTSLYWSYSNGTLCCSLYFIQICGNLIFLPYDMNHLMALKILVHCEKLNVNLKVGF